jgi:hypothetical protein
MEILVFWLFIFGLRLWFWAAMVLIAFPHKSSNKIKKISKSKNFVEWYFLWNIIRTKTAKDTAYLYLYFILNILNHFIWFVILLVKIFFNTTIILEYLMLLLILLELCIMFLTTKRSDH